jgi:parallel beta-helix repeat protein
MKFALHIVTFALLLLGALPQALAQQVQCSGDVTLVNGIIEVAPTDADDTANIQCALDEATRLGVTTVRLARSEYAITRVRVSGFRGSFEGGGAQNTTLVLFEQGIDCAAMEREGETPAGLKFVGGDVLVTRMTIGAANPCSTEPNFPLFFVVHFTGQFSGATCENETGFGRIDRANVIGLGGNPDIWGVGVVAEGYIFGQCNDTLLGTFKLNRSVVGGFNTGIILSLRGSGQVDINFSEFSDSFRHLYVENGNQLMTVQANQFFSFDNLNAAHVSVELFNNELSPAQNRAVIFRNQFQLTEQSNDITVAGVGVFKAAPVNLSLVVSDNRFELEAPAGSGVYVEDTDGANISSNRFLGQPDTGIFLLGGGRGSTVVSNIFSANFPLFADIFLNNSTSGVITGLNAGAFIVDDGSGNVVLDGAAAQALAGHAGVSAPQQAGTGRQSHYAGLRAQVARALGYEEDHVTGLQAAGGQHKPVGLRGQQRLHGVLRKDQGAAPPRGLPAP